MSNTTTLLKQLVGDGGAGQDESHGTPTTRDVLEALASGISPALSVFQDPAAGTAAAMVVERTGRYDVVLAANVGTAGTAGATTVEAQLDGATITGSSVSVDNADADGTSVRAVVEDVLLTRGQVVSIEVTAADASSADGTYTLYLMPVRAE